MLMIFGIFADRTNIDTDPKIIQADSALAAFAFFLFLVYATFGTMLAVFRNDIIKDDETFNSLGRDDAMQSTHSADDDSIDLPPDNI